MNTKWIFYQSIKILILLTSTISALTNEGTKIIASSQMKGGFCVHLGATDGIMTSNLGINKKFIVHGLAIDSMSLKISRKYIRLQGIYGRVSLDIGSFKKLPYAGNLVNLLVIENFQILKKKGLNAYEILRIISPNGHIFINDESSSVFLKTAGFNNIKKYGNWWTGIKPRPKGMDEWTHQRYGPKRSATSKDIFVGPTNSMRWIDGPLRSRGHNGRPPCCISANGKLFYVYDYGPLFSSAPQKVMLIARDAFSGVFLWKKQLSIKTKHDRLLYSGRAMVANGGFLYAPLKLSGPLVKMDNNTGKEIFTYTNSKPDSVIILGSKLLLLSKDKVRLIEEKNGKELWSIIVGGYDNRMIVQDDHIYVHNTRQMLIIKIVLLTGKEVWKQKDKAFNKRTVLMGCNDNIIIHSSSNIIRGLSTKTGSESWSQKYSMSGRGSPRNVFFSKGLVWVHKMNSSKTPEKGEFWKGYEPSSGKLIQSIPVRFQDKCAPGKATERYLISGRLDFTEIENGKTVSSRTVRASCGFGAIPANGMIYTFPTDCRCFPQLKGIMGLGTLNNLQITTIKESNILEKGAGVSNKQTSGQEDWPMYRKNSSRIASLMTEIPINPEQIWETKIGNKISAPIIVAGKVYVASVDSHQIFAVNSSNGKVVWKFGTGGRVTQPPTYEMGNIIFGCHDGWVYCLSATDGKLIWRFNAAPQDKRILAYGQPESPWPILGSVLVHDNKAYFVAGRHTGLDGGIFMYSLDAPTGKVIWKSKVPGLYYQDMLIKSGDYLFLGTSVKINILNGKSSRVRENDVYLKPSRSSPFTDDTFSVRTSWSYMGIVGQMLAIKSNTIVGFTSFPNLRDKYSKTRPGKGDHKLFIGSLKVKNKLSIPLLIRPRGLIIAKDKIFVAGSLDTYPTTSQYLTCYSIINGEKISNINIPSPVVFDGLAVANRKLFLSSLDGFLRCFGKK
ncbi:MAG: hypothetical protein COA79_21115 [Planctomycetota bacterium]|nr:MAG: hypothetical protein COA79_21115 [Planctomycetota bacterium]